MVGVDKKRRLVEIEGVRKNALFRNFGVKLPEISVKGREYAVGCRMVHKDLIYEILSVVEEIPEGCVATYGQIARLIGRDKNSRLVGKVLSMAEYYGDYPCHRVVNHAGRLVPGWLEQRLLLEAEQVVMKDDRHVDLKKCRWDY